MNGSEENWHWKEDYKVKGDVTAKKFIGNGTDITVGDFSLAEIKEAIGCLLHNRLVFGAVSGDGTKVAGEEFQVTKIENKNGQYLIKFTTPFSGTPSGSVTQIYPNLGEFKNIGNTLDNAVIGGIDKDKFRVITGGAGGEPADRCFTFIVVGPR